jgi:hypothetical protein
MEKADISNCIVKVFRKRDGRVSFHLRSLVIFHTKASFSVKSYFKSVTGFLQFPGQEWIEFPARLAIDAAVPYDEKHQVHEFGASFISS